MEPDALANPRALLRLMQVSGIIGLGVCVASVVTGLSVSVSVIAVAWLAHRPVLATLGLATAGALLFFGAQKGRGKQKF